MIRVLLAEDHALVRAGLLHLLRALPDVEVVGEVADGQAALDAVERLRPDLMLLDIAMPRLTGLQVLDRLAGLAHAPRTLMLSMHQDEPYVRHALRAGAAGYLLKDSAPAEMELAIRAIARGETYLSPAVSRTVMSDYAERLRAEAQASDPLTPRQTEVLRLIALGHSSKEIARLLDLSVKTVDTHRSQLMRELGVHEVTGLVRYAVRQGLVTP